VRTDIGEIVRIDTKCFHASPLEKGARVIVRYKIDPFWGECSTLPYGGIDFVDPFMDPLFVPMNTSMESGVTNPSMESGRKQFKVTSREKRQKLYHPGLESENPSMEFVDYMDYVKYMDYMDYMATVA